MFDTFSITFVQMSYQQIPCSHFAYFSSSDAISTLRGRFLCCRLARRMGSYILSANYIHFGHACTRFSRYNIFGCASFSFGLLFFPTIVFK